MSQTAILAGMSSIVGTTLLVLAVYGNKWSTTQIDLPTKIFYTVSGLSMIGVVLPHILQTDLLIPTPTTTNASIIYWFGSILLIATSISILYFMDTTIPKHPLTTFKKYRNKRK
jgi:hypothetical protein